jgi:hypothetical protein
MLGMLTGSKNFFSFTFAILVFLKYGLSAGNWYLLGEGVILFWGTMSRVSGLTLYGNFPPIEKLGTFLEPLM